jgi:hypothetical protein
MDTTAACPRATAPPGSGADVAVQVVPVKVSNAAGKVNEGPRERPPPMQSVADEQESASGWKVFSTAPGGLGSGAAVQAGVLAAGPAAAASAGVARDYVLLSPARIGCG